MPDDKITTTNPVRLLLKDIKSNPANPRVIKDDKFAKLVQSLKDFPEMSEVREVVLNKDHVVLGGNMRLKAMIAAGWTDAPVKIVDWSKAKQDEFVIKDNASFGEWDWSELANQYEAQQLDDWGIDVPKDFLPVNVEEDDAPELSNEPAESVLGQVYQLGRHRVMCGDATDTEAMSLLMGATVADMVFTDPPYGIEYQSNMRVKSEKFDVLKNDDVELDIVPVISQFSKGWVFIWTTWKVIDKWITKTADLGYPSNMVVWHKGGGGIGDLKRTFSTDYEMALVFNRGAELKGKRIGSVWAVSKDASVSYMHPTQKPVSLAAEAIDKTTSSHDLVLDIFLGSGSTLIACEQTDRDCYGMELDPRYVDVIRKRYWKFTHDNDEEGWQDGTPTI